MPEQYTPTKPYTDLEKVWTKQRMHNDVELVTDGADIADGGGLVVTDEQLRDAAISMSDALSTEFPTPSRPNAQSQLLLKDQAIARTGEVLSCYVRENEAQIVFLSSAASLGAHALWGYWQGAFPHSAPPDTHFMNPTGFFCRDDVNRHVLAVWEKYANRHNEPVEHIAQSIVEATTTENFFTLLAPAISNWDDELSGVTPTALAQYVTDNLDMLSIKMAELDTTVERAPIAYFLSVFLCNHMISQPRVDSSMTSSLTDRAMVRLCDRAAIWYVASSKYANRATVTARRTKADIQADLLRNYNSLLLDVDKPTIIFDVCRDTGTTADIVKRSLSEAGLTDVRIAIFNQSGVRTGFYPTDLSIYAPADASLKNTLRDVPTMSDGSLVPGVPINYLQHGPSICPYDVMDNYTRGGVRIAQARRTIGAVCRAAAAGVTPARK